MRQMGIVIHKNDKQVTVKIQNPSQEACGSCTACARLTPQQAANDHLVHIADPKNEWTIGDAVIVEAEVKPLVKAVAVLYSVPFVFLFIGYGLTNQIVKSDPLAGLGAIAGLLLGGVLARVVARRFAKEAQELKIIGACS